MNNSNIKLLNAAFNVALSRRGLDIETGTVSVAKRRRSVNRARRSRILFEEVAATPAVVVEWSPGIASA